MRGTRAVVGHEFEQRGIIPAYAGNTTSTAVPSPLTRDHPRVCGEHTQGGVRRTIVARGSSPRMRGTPHNQRYELRYMDHPRVCGEHRI